MADREGQVTMADTQVKSLVSEQYLDGWSYEDDEESDEGGSPTNPETTGSQQARSGSHSKRQHSEVDKASGDSKPTDKKKFCMSMTSKGKEPSPAVNTGGQPPPAAGKISMSIGATSKISMNVGPSTAKTKAAPIKMNLSSQSKAKEPTRVPSVKQSSAVARAFGSDSEESEEEMPAEARMRMRNIGRETPTAAGPNSFGKGRLGFCDRQKIIERELQKNSD